jgi:hypothetical protein
MVTVKRVFLLVCSSLVALSLLLLPLKALAAAKTPASSLYRWEINPLSQPFNVTTFINPALPPMDISPTCVTHGNGDGFVHVFTVDQNGNLWDTVGQPAGSSGRATNISASAGSQVTQTVGVGALYLGGTNPSTQVFALQNGHLLSFVGLGDGGVWQVFDLSSLSGSGANLTTAPTPIVVGSTVHVYATDSNKHLHDFYKPITSNWQDIDLTNQTGVHAIIGRPYFYGGNSIQTVSTSSGGDLLTFVQIVNPDGTINFGAGTGVTDLTQVSGTGVKPLGISSSVVVGSTVTIFVDSTSGTLVEFYKTPTSNWQVFSLLNLGQTNLTPATLFIGGSLFVLSNTSGNQLFEGASTTLLPPFNFGGLPNLNNSGASLDDVGDPCLSAPFGGNSALFAYNLIFP